MSEAKNINSFPLAKNLWKGDMLLLTDSTGKGIKADIGDIGGIGGARKNFTCPSTQWVRFATFSGFADGLISFTTYWQNTAGQRTLVDLLLHANSTSFNKCTVLSSMTNSGRIVAITKVRVVTKVSSPGYIDFFYAPTSTNPGHLSILNGSGIILLNELEYNAEIPEGYSSTEFNLTNPAWGGV